MPLRLLTESLQVHCVSSTCPPGIACQVPGAHVRGSAQRTSLLREYKRRSLDPTTKVFRSPGHHPMILRRTLISYHRASPTEHCVCHTEPAAANSGSRCAERLKSSPIHALCRTLSSQVDERHVAPRSLPDAAPHASNRPSVLIHSFQGARRLLLPFGMEPAAWCYRNHLTILV